MRKNEIEVQERTKQVAGCTFWFETYIGEINSFEAVFKKALWLLTLASLMLLSLECKWMHLHILATSFQRETIHEWKIAFLVTETPSEWGLFCTHNR